MLFSKLTVALAVSRSHSYLYCAIGITRAAGKKAIFLWPVAPNNVSVETNVFDAISSFAQSCSNHTPPTARTPVNKYGHCCCGHRSLLLLSSVM